MEENNNNLENTQNIKHRHICFENHCWKMCLAMVIAAFIGGFLAFYFVADQIMERKYKNVRFHPKYIEHKIFDDFEKQYKRDVKSFEDMFEKHHKIHRDMLNNDFGMPVFMMNAVKIKTELDDNNYNIVVGLKPFQGDDNKIQYKINGSKLTVFGESVVKDKNMEQDIAFSQDFILPDNADIDNIKRIKEGKNLVISIPLKD